LFFLGNFYLADKSPGGKAAVDSPVHTSTGEMTNFKFCFLDSSRTETALLSSEVTLFSLRMHVKRSYGAQKVKETMMRGLKKSHGGLGSGVHQNGRCDDPAQI
jgi:hypothetical protein